MIYDFQNLDLKCTDSPAQTSSKGKSLLKFCLYSRHEIGQWTLLDKFFNTQIMRVKQWLSKIPVDLIGYLDGKIRCISNLLKKTWHVKTFLSLPNDSF